MNNEKGKHGYVKIFKLCELSNVSDQQVKVELKEMFDDKLTG